VSLRTPVGERARDRGRKTFHVLFTLLVVISLHESPKICQIHKIL
jgi:hypothetical protein